MNYEVQQEAKQNQVTKKPANEPSIKHMEIGFRDTLGILIYELKQLDSLIFNYADAIERASPLFSGKIMIKFSNRIKIKIGNESFYDKKPCVGIYYKNKSTGGVFVWNDKIDLKNLANKRASKHTPWDRVVKNLLKEVGPLMIKREEIRTEIQQLRVVLSRSHNSLRFLRIKAIPKFNKLNEQVTWDFTKDAYQLLSDFQEQKKKKQLQREIDEL